MLIIGSLLTQVASSETEASEELRGSTSIFVLTSLTFGTAIPSKILSLLTAKNKKGSN